MKALSLLQPWASLVVMGAKEWETRPWDTVHRGPLVIHASGRLTKEALLACYREPMHHYLLKAGIADLEALPLGKIIGVVDVVNSKKTVDVVNHVTLQEFTFGDFSPRRYAFELKNPRPVPHVLCGGCLSLWDVPQDVLRKAGLVEPEPVAPLFGAGA